MRKITTMALALALLSGLTATRASADSPAPIRHLVYNFTYTSTQKQTLRSSGIGGATDNGGEMGSAPTSMGSTESMSGSVDYSAGLNDKGTITVDVTSIQSDGGISVNVSESSEKSRAADVAACVVYGNTNVLCDPNAKVNPEEYSVIQLLGRGFISPAEVDAKNHWRVANSNAQAAQTTDFTIDKTEGDIAHITTENVVKASGPQGFTATTDGTILYDTKRTIPTQIVEDSTTRSDQGSDSYTTTRVQTSFTLTSDSLAAAGQ